MNFGNTITLIRTSFNAVIDTLTLTANRTYNLPNKSGTFALLDDIPVGGGASVSEYLDVSASRNILLTDSNKMLSGINTTTITLTIKEDAIANFPLNTEIEITQDNTGSVIITKDASVTLWGDGRTLNSYEIFDRFNTVTLKKKSSNNWRIYGSLKW